MNPSYNTDCMTEESEPQRKRLWIGLAIFVVAIFVGVYILSIKPDEPLGRLDGLHYLYDYSSVGSLKGGTAIYVREVRVQDSPEAATQAVAKAVNGIPGWHAKTYQHATGYGRYGWFVGFFKNMSYEIVVDKSYDPTWGTIITETRQATAGEAFNARVKDFFDGLWHRERRA